MSTVGKAAIVGTALIVAALLWRPRAAAPTAEKPRRVPPATGAAPATAPPGSRGSTATTAAEREADVERRHQDALATSPAYREAWKAYLTNRQTAVSQRQQPPERPKIP